MTVDPLYAQPVNVVCQRLVAALTDVESGRLLESVLSAKSPVLVPLKQELAYAEQVEAEATLRAVAVDERISAYQEESTIMAAQLQGRLSEACRSLSVDWGTQVDETSSDETWTSNALLLNCGQLRQLRQDSLSVPFLLPVLGRANMRLWLDESRLSALLDALLYAMCRAASKYSIRAIVYDPDIAGGADRFVDSPDFVEVIHSADQLKAVIEMMSDDVARTQARLTAQNSTILDEVRRDPANHTLSLLVLCGHPPKNMTVRGHDGTDIVTTLSRRGPAAGLSIVDASADHRWKLAGEVEEIGLSHDEQFQWRRAPHLVLNLDIPSSKQISEAIASLGSSRASKDFNIADFLEFESWRESTAGGATFTLGSSNGRPVTLTFMADDFSHILITGSTQMGKSTLMRSMMHEMAWRYSPAEIQFAAIDLKEGLAFQELAPSLDDATYLPHVSKMMLGTDSLYAHGVLDHLTKETKNRQRSFRDAGVAGYGEYRLRSLTDASLKVIPRLLVFIDEVNRLFDDGGEAARNTIRVLTDLAKTSAGSGVHLIVATQSESVFSKMHVGGDPTGFLDQFQLRVRFQGRDTIGLPGKGFVSYSVAGKISHEPLRAAMIDSQAARRWREDFGSRSFQRPSVFEVQEIPNAADWRDYSTPDATLSRLTLGFSPRKLGAPALASLDAASPPHIAVIGAQGADATVHYGLGTVQAIVLQLASLLRSDPDATMIIIDQVRQSIRPSASLEPWLEEVQSTLGRGVKCLTSLDQLEELAPTLPEGEPASWTVVVLLDGGNHSSADPQPGYQTIGKSPQLSSVLQYGWRHRTVVVGWWSEEDQLATQVTKASVSKMPWRLYWGLNETTARQHVGPTSEEGRHLGPNRLLAVGNGHAEIITPFSPFSEESDQRV